MQLARFILVALICMGFGINMSRHGEPRKDRYDAFVSFIAVVIQFTFLYLGGFFN